MADTDTETKPEENGVVRALDDIAYQLERLCDLLDRLTCAANPQDTGDDAPLMLRTLNISD